MDSWSPLLPQVEQALRLELLGFMGISRDAGSRTLRDLQVAYSAPVIEATAVFVVYPIGQGSFSDVMGFSRYNGTKLARSVARREEAAGRA